MDIPIVSIPKVDHDNLVRCEFLEAQTIANKAVLTASYGSRIWYV